MSAALRRQLSLVLSLGTAIRLISWLAGLGFLFSAVSGVVAQGAAIDVSSG